MYNNIQDRAIPGLRRGEGTTIHKTLFGFPLSPPTPLPFPLLRDLVMSMLATATLGAPTNQGVSSKNYLPSLYFPNSPRNLALPTVNRAEDTEIQDFYTFGPVDFGPTKPQIPIRETVTRCYYTVRQRRPRRRARRAWPPQTRKSTPQRH